MHPGRMGDVQSHAKGEALGDNYAIYGSSPEREANAESSLILKNYVYHTLFICLDS